MKLAFRSHLPTHKMTNQDVGGGITRAACTICPHVEIHVADAASEYTLEIPAWLQGPARTLDPVTNGHADPQLVAA